MNKRKDKSVIRMEDYDPSQKDVKPTKSKSEKPLLPSKPSHPKNEKPSQDGVYEIVEDLPTGGKLYPEGTTIKARPLNVIEAKMLSNMTEDNANDIVNEILERTVIGIDVEDIYLSDKLFIAFWLRAVTYKDSGYEVKFECPKCKQQSTYAFELDQLDIKDLKDEDIENINREFKLPNGDKIKYKYLTVKDENNNTKFLRQNKTSMMNFDEEILTICRMIKTVNGENLGMIDKYMYVTTKLTPMEYSYLESYFEDVSVGLEPTVHVKCRKCGGASETMLPFRPDFFLPKVQTK